MDNSEKIICGDSIEIDEIDDEEQITQKEISYKYDMQNIIDSINTEEFKILWDSSILKIRSENIDIQRRFLYNIFDKINNEYSIDLNTYINLYEINNFENIYELVYFIEVGIINFLGVFLSSVNLEINKLKNIDFKKLCDDHFNFIDKYILFTLKNPDYLKNKILSKFLLTYNKDEIIKWFENKFMKNKIDIISISVGIV
jgi:hypothetical protein